VNSTFTAEQRELRASARRFARTVLFEVAPAIRGLSSPEERFLATRPMYEEAIREGFLRKLIPVPFGGDGQGLMDMAILAEEFYAVDASVPLTLFGNALGLMPLFIAGTPEQREKYLAPFLTRSGAPLAALANSEPGGSANFDAPYPGEGEPCAMRKAGRFAARNSGFRVPPAGTVKAQTFCVSPVGLTRTLMRHIRCRC
jgi:alkylation response protein AidB-like acyl-CoA dehydrogenase